jgi:translation initiation factor IF-2
MKKNMSEANDKENKDGEKKTLSLGGKGTLTLKASGTAAAAPRQQNISQGRGRTVAVEVRKKRSGPTGPKADTPESIEVEAPIERAPVSTQQAAPSGNQLTNEEHENRVRAILAAEEAAKRRAELLQDEAQASDEQVDQVDDRPVGKPVRRILTNEELRAKELAEIAEIEAAEVEARAKQNANVKAHEKNRETQEGRSSTQSNQQKSTATAAAPARPATPADAQAAAQAKFGNRAAAPTLSKADEDEEKSYRDRMKKSTPARAPRRAGDDARRGGKITVTQALNSDDERGGRSLASQRRAREKARLAALDARNSQEKFSREVIVPETITVQELSNRMAERGGDLIKALMKMGVMATINQTIDADTAELLIMEFGHKIKRVSDSDIEDILDLGFNADDAGNKTRPPVVTIMGHVDHGKTSLLDAMRKTDVVSGEAGGITQHIGAYQVTMPQGEKITFLDTPGHAAFTQMRARGANITDIVVLVVAANDSIMPQTAEAISHAKAAGVPIIVAINKIDLPEANVQKVKNDLLLHEIVVEELGGDTQVVELSAKKRINLDKLEEAILLQAEVLGLQANPNRVAAGTVVEARLEQGRGNVATVLIQEGTLRIGDIIVIGAEWGRIRTMLNDRGEQIKEAIPGQPIEITGLNGSPEAGDKFGVVPNESKARDISEYRHRKRREASSVVSASGSEGMSTFDRMLHQHREGQKKALNVVIKGDVHGSVEAIIGSLAKIGEDNEEVNVNILHSGVGGITESDVILARASNALIVGFNVRANAQARELAEREKVDIRYYNIIYNVIDDARAILTGLLAPSLREEYLGQADIRQVFNITKVGKIAGCMVKIGVVKRGAKVRLLRDDVVIHEGTLKTLKRFKDEVKEVKEGMECGMAFENYDDIKEGDIIECYQIVEEARQLAN